MKNERQTIQDLLRRIAIDEFDCEGGTAKSADYIDQRRLISSLFQGSYSLEQVILCLTVIDSLYSTNASYSYFSFEEMAERIFQLGNQTQARDYFYHVALTGEDEKQLFSEPYGIQKDLREGSRQMSLLSKYAYYDLMQDLSRYPLGFPIYDRLAKEAYPTVCRMLGAKHYVLPSSDVMLITDYIRCISQLRSLLFDDEKLYQPGKYPYQQYDILDAYLWRMGKFSGGNLSLLLGRDDYCKFIRNIHLDAATTGDELNSDAFNKRVLESLRTHTAPFEGCSNGKYLDCLLSHWRLFETYEKVRSSRGLSALPTKQKSEVSAETASLDGDVVSSAHWQEYQIYAYRSGHISVVHEGQVCRNVIAALRDISHILNFPYEEKWNTQQFGMKLIRYLESTQQESNV